MRSKPLYAACASAGARQAENRREMNRVGGVAQRRRLGQLEATRYSQSVRLSEYIVQEGGRGCHMIFRQELSLRGLETRQLIGTDLQLNKPPEPRPRPLLEPVRPLLDRHATRARARDGRWRGAARRGGGLN